MGIVDAPASFFRIGPATSGGLRSLGGPISTGDGAEMRHFQCRIIPFVGAYDFTLLGPLGRPNHSQS